MTKPPSDVLDLFLSQVDSTSAHPAVDSHGVSTSYEDLYSLSFRIAAAITQAAPIPGPRVLVAVPPSTSAYAAMIGCLAAGGTFCALNLDGPETRNVKIAREFSPHVTLFETFIPAFLDELPATIPRIDTKNLGPTQLASRANEFSEVAYVVFTSGSTGQPKGVKVGRYAFSHFLNVAREIFAGMPGERWAQYSNLGYDLAIMDVFMALSQGCTLVPLVTPKDRLMPATAIRAHRIAIWQSVPSALELMSRAGQLTGDFLASLRLMSFCGEPLLPRQLDALFSAKPDLQVFNTYGATETVGFNTINRLDAQSYRSSCQGPTVALGGDVAGWSLSLRGDSPDEGEIVVSGDCLSLGYWRDEEGTRAAFRQVATDSTTSLRSYFTGDWGIRKSSGLYFLSRIDRQIKIRGERIELDEVDWLLRDAGFPAAFTIVVGDNLHSFVEAAGNVDQDLVRQQLTKHLPFHSVPKAIHALPALPRNANGKVDPAALIALIAT